MSELTDRVKQLSRPLAPEPTGEQPLLPELHGISAVVFDIYGTLLVSGSGDISLAKEGGRGSAAEQALAEVGVDLPGGVTGDVVVELLHNAIRDSHAKLRVELADCKHPEVEIRDVWRAVIAELGRNLGEHEVELLAIEYECRVNPIWPMPGMVETLDVLRDAGLKLGIVSNAQFFTPLALETLSGRSLAELGFDDPMLCGWSYQHREAKPASVLHDGVMEGLGVYHIDEPSKVLYVGNDMLNDVWTAKNLHWRAALFAGDKRSLRWRTEDPRVAGVRPDAIITDLRQIIPILALAEG